MPQNTFILKNHTNFVSDALFLYLLYLSFNSS